MSVRLGLFISRFLSGESWRSRSRRISTRMALYGEHGPGDGKQEISQIRNPYRSSNDVFNEDCLVSKDPLKQFESWFNTAVNHESVDEVNAMTLATVGADGKPSARIVLLKGFGSEGFKFFTNYESRKGRDLASNPNVALVLFWAPLHRSVRIEGAVEKLNESESAKYFATRPWPSQIAAHVSSCQSSPIENRQELLKVEKKLEEKYNGMDVPKPDYWGGFLVKPEMIEFWQGQSNRMHDRIRFRRKASDESVDTDPCLNKGENGWVYERLMP